MSGRCKAFKENNAWMMAGHFLLVQSKSFGCGAVRMTEIKYREGAIYD